MTNVSIHEIRNHGEELVDRVAQGEPITITRAGKVVAEMRPVSGPTLSAASLLDRWNRLPPVDVRAFRADLDVAIDS